MDDAELSISNKTKGLLLDEWVGDKKPKEFKKRRRQTVNKGENEPESLNLHSPAATVTNQGLSSAQGKWLYKDS